MKVQFNREEWDLEYQEPMAELIDYTLYQLVHQPDDPNNVIAVWRPSGGSDAAFVVKVTDYIGALEYVLIKAKEMG